MSEPELVEKELNEILEKHKILPKHTDFQIENFMIGKEFTLAGRVWQCVRELSTRQEALLNINLEIEETNDNLQLQEIKYEKLKLKSIFNKKNDIQALNQKQKEIFLRKKERQIRVIKQKQVSLDERKKSIVAESSKILELFKKYNPENKIIDIEDKKTQLDYWNEKLDQELGLTSVLGHPLSMELVRSVLALPNEAPVKMQMNLALENAGKKLLNQSN